MKEHLNVHTQHLTLDLIKASQQQGLEENEQDEGSLKGKNCYCCPWVFPIYNKTFCLIYIARMFVSLNDGQVSVVNLWFFSFAHFILQGARFIHCSMQLH